MGKGLGGGEAVGLEQPQSQRGVTGLPMPPLDQTTRAHLELTWSRKQAWPSSLVISGKAGMSAVSLGREGDSKLGGLHGRAVCHTLALGLCSHHQDTHRHLGLHWTPPPTPPRPSSVTVRGGVTPAVAGTSHWPMLGLPQR